MTPCIEFAGYKTAKGYGMIRREGKCWRAHRWAYYQAYGPIPDGMVVRHKCDNPACVNPDHLELGTQADNMADMHQRGRAKVGSEHGHAVFTDEQIRNIRATHVHRCKERGAVALGKQYGVAQSVITRIVNRETYKDVL